MDQHACDKRIRSATYSPAHENATSASVAVVWMRKERDTTRQTNCTIRSGYTPSEPNDKILKIRLGNGNRPARCLLS